MSHLYPNRIYPHSRSLTLPQIVRENNATFLYMILGQIIKREQRQLLIRIVISFEKFPEILLHCRIIRRHQIESYPESTGTFHPVEPSSLISPFTCYFRQLFMIEQKQRIPCSRMFLRNTFVIFHISKTVVYITKDRVILPPGLPSPDIPSVKAG